MTVSQWIWLVLLPLTGGLQSQDIMYVVLSQPNVLHAKKAEQFKSHLSAQFFDQKPTILLLHETWGQTKGAWTVLPTFSKILDKYGDKQMVFFCEEDTRVDAQKLLRSISSYDSAKNLFIGRALFDQEPSIIHHFAFHDSGVHTFPFPDFSAGFFLSMSLIKSLADRWTGGRQGIGKDFSIDPKHELAMFIWNQGKGLRMTAVPFLCAGEKESASDVCASTFMTQQPSCKPISDDQLFVAVKTCEKFHRDRVPVVKSTWGLEAEHIEYYSETDDQLIPTTVLGVPNTEKGHCGKLQAILMRANTKSHITNKDWILIADDDTIISISRLKSHLGCFNPADPVVIGERYGFGLSRPSGYDYLTGGSGMVLSHMAVRILMDTGKTCFSDDAPDDMTLGMWLDQLSIPITHSPLFHQATPSAYPKEYLDHQVPISFHKHWNVDPYHVYHVLLGGYRNSSQQVQDSSKQLDSAVKDEL